MTPEQRHYTVAYMERNYPQGVAAIRAAEREHIAQAIADECELIGTEVRRVAESVDWPANLAPMVNAYSAGLDRLVHVAREGAAARNGGSGDAD